MSIKRLAIATFALLSSAASTFAFEIESDAGNTLNAEIMAEFNQPWAMDFLPDGQLLVTTKPGRLYLVRPNGAKQEIKGLPRVANQGQGGLGDVVVHPDFATNGLLYFSYAEADGNKTGAVVERATLDLNAMALRNRERLWEQLPKTSGRGHYSHKIAFGPKGSLHEGKIFITSGDRQKMSPAQDMRWDLGKIIRLNEDGSVPRDNPWQGEGERAKLFWSMGHRNMLGIDFAADGRLWVHEMGPRHGDEINVIEPGQNYGWPVVSEGNHYNGTPIPAHNTDSSFVPPKAFWVPSIAPSGLMIYIGDQFPAWQGDGFIGGLAGSALIRLDISGSAAKEAERFEWGERIRDVEQSADGAIYVLEDREGGRLLKLTPR